ncbi:NAD(+)/NADH kinase [candidate division WOR-3 bacterium]|uniref:NAD kinase n=1 Tax=candidate division WOR-3 bacterium TaxID=2052148 RepID=A0A938BQ61_UNCW3|nr:NAD(+)/NADH kinase [candidate division WOR-3 bacterium]
MSSNSKRIGFMVNRDKPLATKLVPDLVRWLRAAGHVPLLSAGTAKLLRVTAECGPAAKLAEKADLVVACGGDGTLLRAARLVGSRDVPIMGVNLGGLGFLTEFSTAEAQAGIEDFCRGAHSEERRMVLACRYGRKSGFALNDIAVNMGTANRAIELVASSGGVLVTRYIGDGVVVATPTGSTAYSLAAGGPVVYPTMQAILLTPLSPHALASRPMILPPDAKVELELSRRSESAILNLDGQERWIVRPGRPLHISRADFTIRLVTPKDKTYFQILRDKLKWTGSQR